MRRKYIRKMCMGLDLETSNSKVKKKNKHELKENKIIIFKCIIFLLVI